MTDPANDNGLIPLSGEQAREILERGEIDQDYRMLRWSSNYAFLVGIALDDITLTAVYKPQKGERPLWDFPDGTLCYREYASYLTSEALGWQLVPPTVLRSGKRGLGSFQLFIEHDPEQHYFTFDESIKPQLAKLAVFDYLVNNADRKGGHCLLDARGHLWAIDHGITFHTANKLRTVIWDFAGEQIPAELLTDIDRLCHDLEDRESNLRKTLDDTLATQEIRAFQARIRNILQTRAYPVPGPGPNYPWPPV
ncbi:MAG: hypothetical protein UZ15_CFX003002314 [Chloroflexi bacterium OLB15]|nr:MAG: hypothetical protein UZ15_CFX003002314 [Chloroflexi bacterium OLB15]